MVWGNSGIFYFCCISRTNVPVRGRCEGQSRACRRPRACGPAAVTGMPAHGSVCVFVVLCVCLCLYVFVFVWKRLPKGSESRGTGCSVMGGRAGCGRPPGQLAVQVTDHSDPYPKQPWSFFWDIHIVYFQENLVPCRTSRCAVIDSGKVVRVL